jgi:5-methylthioadenosine/S-adenosylhomocysteine deaminase
MPSPEGEAAADLLIRDAYIVTVDPARRVFTNGYIAFTGGRISHIGRMADGAPPAREVLDGRSRMVLPGMVNGHNHLVQNCLRGYNDDRWPVLDIPAAVRRLMEQLFAIAGRMDAERTRAIVRLHALEMLKSGYVATHDEHFTNTRKDSVDGAWTAIRESGMRGYLCRCIVNSHGVPDEGREDVETGLAEVERLKALFDGDRIAVATGFVNFNFLSDPEDMRRVREGADRLGVAFGVDMTDNARGQTLKARGFDGGQVEYYRRFGLLETPIYAGKAVNVLPHEYDILAEHDCRVALVPALRFFDAAGLSIHEFLKRGMLPGLGTDAPLVSDSQDPFEVMRLAIYAQNLATKRERAAGGELPDAAHWVVAERAIEMATLGGARALFMDEVTGSLEVGKAADCIILDTARADFAPTYDGRRAIGSLVWGGGAKLVDCVFVGGEKLIENGRSTRWDEAELAAEAERALRDISREAGLERFLPPRVAGASYRGWTYS